MARQTGTAFDYHDLLDQLRIFAVANGWTQLEHTPATARDGGIPDPIDDDVRLASIQTLTLRGPGTGAGREVFLTFETIADTVFQHYSIRPYGHTAWTSGLPVLSQPGAGGGPFLGLVGGSMAYWFYINDRRIIVVARSGTTYTSMYAGFLVAHALPSEYTHPLYVAGNYLENRIPAFANARNRFIADPGLGSAYYRAREGDWQQVVNHEFNNSNDTGYDENNAPVLWPFGSTQVLDSNSDNLDWCYGGLRLLRANALGEIVVFPCNLIDGRVNIYRLVGILDGVYAVPGFNRTTEESITVSGQTMDVFSNVFRSSTRDFMGIEDTA